MKRLLFYDSYATDSEIIGGSTRALRNLFQVLSASGEHDLHLLLNDSGLQAELYRKSGAAVHHPRIMKFASVYGHSKNLTINTVRLILSYPFINLWFIGFCLKNKFDVIVFNESRGLLTFLPSAVILRRKIVAYSRGSIDLKRRILLFSYRFCRKLICVSEAVRKDIPEIFLGKSEVIYDAYIPHFEATSSKKAGAILNLVSIGSIVPNKGFEVALMAIALISAPAREKIFYKIFGPFLDKGYSAKLVDLVKERNLSEVVEFKGFIGDVYSILVEADALIVPSFSEGLGLVILEAFDASVPVIGSMTGGIPELIEDTKNGFLFRPGDARALSDILTNIILKREILQGMRESARKRLIEFISNNQAERFSGLINNI